METAKARGAVLPVGVEGFGGLVTSFVGAGYGVEVAVQCFPVVVNGDVTTGDVFVDFAFSGLPSLGPEPPLVCWGGAKLEYAVLTLNDFDLRTWLIEVQSSAHFGGQSHYARLDGYVSAESHPFSMAVSPAYGITAQLARATPALRRAGDDADSRYSSSQPSTAAAPAVCGSCGTRWGGGIRTRWAIDGGRWRIRVGAARRCRRARIVDSYCLRTEFATSDPYNPFGRDVVVCANLRVAAGAGGVVDVGEVGLPEIPDWVLRGESSAFQGLAG